MPKRLANGEGNIRKRKDGRWEGRYTAGYDPENGKRLIKNVLGKTQAEVKEKDGFFGEPSARAVNSPPSSCYKDSIEQVAPAMPRARHEPI